MRPSRKHKTPQRRMSSKPKSDDEEDDELNKNFLIIEDIEVEKNARTKKIMLGVLILVLVSFIAFPTYLIFSNQEIKVINFHLFGYERGTIEEIDDLNNAVYGSITQKHFT